jgi:hypothetical protein
MTERLGRTWARTGRMGKRETVRTVRFRKHRGRAVSPRRVGEEVSVPRRNTQGASLG